MGTPRQVIYDWLRGQARRLGIQASLLTHQATTSDGRLYLPVYVGNATDAYDGITKLQELEDGWNYQDPQPSLPIYLVPSSDKPEWLEAYEPTQKAVDRYDQAFSVFRTARSQEEADKALEEMKAAKIAELESSELFDRAA